MGVIIIIAVFWLLGLLMAWSMCVVAARADAGEKSAIPTRTRISAGPLTPATWTSGDASPADKDRRIPRLHNKKGYPMENTNLKRLAAMCAAAASLSTLGLAGTAMAVETPTTSDTGTASITLNAAQGNTLTGHTFDFYRLGSYGDITANGDTDVKSLTVNKIDDASDKWIAAANAKAGIADLQGFDAAGDLAHVGKDGEPTGTVQGQLREAAKQLAATASTAGTDGKAPTVTKTVTGSGATMTVADLPNGLYLIVDSAGSPMIVGTPIQGSKTLNGVTLGALTIKSKTVAIDKKVSHDRKDKATLIDSKAGNAASSASWNVGDTVDFQYEFTLGNKQNTVKMVVTDTMDGLTLSGDPVFKVGQTAIKPTVVKTNGFTATFDQNLVKQYENKKVTVTYKATVTNATRAKQASNTVALASTQYDGTAQAATTVDTNDTATVSAYDLNVKKTNWDGKTTLAGAGFKIKDTNTNKWMKQTGGSWSYVAEQKDATEFLTGDNGQVNIAGLGAGDYQMVESKVPDNMTSLVTATFNFHITDAGVVTVDGDANKLISGQPTSKNEYTITVRNIDALTELPQTGGLLGNTMIGVVVIAMAGGVAYLTVQSKRRREAHTL